MIVRFIGDTSVFPDSLKEKINTLTEVSKDNTGLNLTVAIYDEDSRTLYYCEFDT